MVSLILNSLTHNIVDIWKSFPNITYIGYNILHYCILKGRVYDRQYKIPVTQHSIIGKIGRKNRDSD
ncbi:hypothetical protein KAR91_69005, partial [Candidatus Pacearchaeota archaeon]|nr:hypothetical protein [Candidatus Pacearchaeota archaeon]